MKESNLKEKLEEEKVDDLDNKKEKTDTKTLEKEKEPKKKQQEPKFKKSEKKSKKIEKELENMDTKKSKKGRKIALLVGCILVILIFISTIFAIVNINNEKILSGISIKGIDVSGLTKEEAKAKFETIYNEKKQKDINVKYEDYETSLNPTLMEVNYNIDGAVEEAYQIGRYKNIIVNNYEVLFALIGKKDIDIKMRLNEEITNQLIQDVGVNIPGIVIESSYSIEEDKLIITRGKEGKYIDSEKLLEMVKDNLNDINVTNNYLEIPVIDKKPEEIDLDKIHEEVYKEVKDAYYTKEPFEIFPEVEGIDFDVEAAKAMIASEYKEEYEIPLIITKPKVTINEIGTEAFPDQLGTFTTRYDASLKDRSTNLEIACQKLDGKVILVGEEFSYNKTLGARTAAAGYKNAAVYENGQVVDGIGGGICQISSTLYNAVLLANLEVTERRNHQFITSYVPAGRDATVVYGMIDFKFKNTRQFPVRISASAKNGIATVSIYGIKEENEYTFTFNTKTVATIPFSTKYVEDSSLSAGTEKVKQKGTNGLKTETYITKSLNGKVVSTTLLSKDTYDAMNRIVLRGPSNNNEKTNEKETTNQTTNQIQNQDTQTNTQTNTSTENQTSNKTTEKTNTQNNVNQKNNTTNNKNNSKNSNSAQ